MSNDDKMTGMKKRQQLVQTSKNIFVWVAGAAVIVTICAVSIQFLVQQGFFNQKIIDEMQKTERTLSSNVQNIEKLKDEVNKLRLDPNLAKVPVNSAIPAESSNLQVVLDALPTKNDSASFANSMASVILPRSNVSIEALTAGEQVVASASATATPTVTVTPLTPQTLSFSATIKGSYEQITQALLDIERVIRPIKITQLTIQGSDASLGVTIQGVTYYLPAASVELGSKKVEP